jgi:hypothetical protein
MTASEPGVKDANELGEQARKLRARLGEFRGRL